MAKKKPNGYWKNREVVVKEANRIMKEHNFDRLPRGDKLRSMGEGAFLSGIIKHHGGLRAFREKLGQENPEVPKGSWKDFDYVVEQAKEIMKKHKLKVLPGQTKLVKLGYNSFAMAMGKYHGGMRKLREHLGQEKIINPQGIWKDLDYALEQAKEIKTKYNFERLPGREKLVEIGYGGLESAIYKYHGGMNKFRGHLGEEIKREKSEDLRNFDYIINKAKEIMKNQKLEKLPNGEELVNLGYSSFVSAVKRYHGGLNELRKKLGQNDLVKPNGYWKNWENAKKELLNIIEKYNLSEFPTQKFLCDIKRSSLVSAITNHHGGVFKVQEKLGFDFSRKHKDYWSNVKNILNEIKNFKKEENYDYFPSADTLKDLGYSSLSVAISQHYPGGLTKYREDHNDFTPMQLGEKTQRMLDLEKEFGISIEDHIRELYNKGKSAFKIGNELGVSETTIYHWFENLGIEKRGPKIRSESQLTKFFSENPDANEIGNLIYAGGNSSEIADILIELYPNRFLSAVDLARSLPKAIKSIGESLYPFKIEKAEKIWDNFRTKTPKMKYHLENILYNIIVDNYQRNFNENPEETVKELNYLSSKKKEISPLIKKVSDYYSSIYEFNIPGQGKLEAI